MPVQPKQTVQQYLQGGGIIPGMSPLRQVAPGDPSLLNKRGTRMRNKVPGNQVVQINPNLNQTVNQPAGSIGIGDFERGQVPGGVNPILSGAPRTGGTLNTAPSMQQPMQTPPPIQATPQNPLPFPQGQGSPYNQTQLPDYPQYQFQGSPGPGLLQDVFSQSTGGTINAFNTAANRLRERVDAATRANSEALNNQNLSRGLGVSGMNRADQFRNREAGLNAYAQGLSGLENQFEQNRLQGLGIANQAAGEIQQGGLDYNRLMQGDLSDWRRGLFDLLNSREGRSSTENIAALQAELQRQLQQGSQKFEGGQNQAERSLREMLAKLGFQNQNWQAALGIGANQNPGVVQYPGLQDSIGRSILEGAGIFF